MHSTDIQYEEGRSPSYDGMGRRVFSNPEIFTIHHNGDYSGDAKILLDAERVKLDSFEQAIVEIPIEVVVEFVGQMLISKDISEMEQQYGVQRLGFQPGAVRT